MAADAGTSLFLSTPESGPAELLLREAAGEVPSVFSLSHFLANPHISLPSQNRICLPLPTEHRKAAAAAVPRLLSHLKANGLLITAVDAKDAPEVRGPRR